MEDENRLIQERKKKLDEIRDLGIEPYPYSYEKTDSSSEINSKFSELKPEEHSKYKAKSAGRIIALRRMGKASFAHIQDQDGKLQLYLSQDNLGKEKYNFLKKIDIGDFIGVEGFVFKTRTGEITIEVKNFELLSKSLRPLPEKFHGLKDEELRYRQRYVDLIVNPEVKEVFLKRTKIINAMREFLNKEGFIEVEIPTLQTIYGGANARPFKTHINAWNLELFLSISPETYLKRLIVGGFEKVYTICKNFRNEGVDKSHNPEFTMVECYWSYADYNDMMKLTENMVSYIVKKVLGTMKVKYMDKEIDFTPPWEKMKMTEAIKKYAEIDVEKLSDEELFELRTTYNIDYEGDLNRGTMTALLFEELVEDKLIQPTFIIDHPKEMAPLCKLHRQNKDYNEQFEPYVNGWELGNAYSELNDPILQRERLEEQAKQLRAGSEEAHPMDEDFVRAIETGMPPCGGLGIGVDRLVMLIAGVSSIRDVIFFPTMKPETK